MVRALEVAALTLASCVTPGAPIQPSGPRADAPPAHDPLANYQIANGTQYGPPGPTLEARPWEMGQWVAYKRRDGANVSVETLRLLALDNCGVWIEYATDDGHRAHSWQFCVRGPVAPDDTQLHETLWSVIERRDRVIVASNNFRRGGEDRTRFEWLPRLVHAAWPGHDEAPREDLVVPAGHFAQTIKLTSTADGAETTRWSHPSVPLGGLVREVTGDRERVLVGFGYSRRRSVVMEMVDDIASESPPRPTPRGTDEPPCMVGVRLSPTVCQTSPRIFLRIAFGLGGASRNGDVAPGGGWSWSMQFGQRLGHHLHLVEEVNAVSWGASLTPSVMSEAHVSFGAGIQWRPFEPRPHASRVFPFPGRLVDMRALTLTAVAGANVRDRIAQTTATESLEESTWSPMASVAVGLLEIQGRDWSLGPEFREQLTRYDGRFQRGWQLLVAVHLNSW